MENFEEIDSINNTQRYLIDYANIKNGIIPNQDSFLNLEQTQNFMENPQLGLPMLLPLNMKSFNYKNCKNIFSLNRKEVSKKFFKSNDVNYIGVKTFFLYGNRFCIGAKPKKKYNNLINSINKQNNELKKKIINLKKNNKIVGAFQTRNVPHLGHEKIIEMLLQYCDHVIINPLIGPKKKGDFKNNIIRIAYEYLSKNIFNNKISYMPLYANMYYAGPREAIHHSLLRKSVGFDYFIVGRDHAGAENIYHPDDAFNLLEQYKKDIGIEVLTHQGSFYDSQEKKVIIKNKGMVNKNLININGSEFREHLNKRIIYKFARTELQEYLYKFNDDYFIKY